MKIGLTWVYMGRYGLILKLDGALWLTIILKPLPTPKKGYGSIKHPQKSKKSSRAGQVYYGCSGHWPHGHPKDLTKGR